MFALRGGAPRQGGGMNSVPKSFRMPMAGAELILVALVCSLSVQAETREAEDPQLIWTPNSVVLVSKELASGVYAVFADDAAAKNAGGIPAATSGGFVVGDDGVLVIDSMLNRRLAKQLLALIRAETARPILYLVNTSYHGDHSYGNQFFPAGVQIVQHAATQAYIQSHFAEDVAFMTQYFGRNSGMDELKPQRAQILLQDGAKIQFELGNKSVHVMHLGFAQTNGDLFVWLPMEKVLFAGNPIISDGPSLPWLLDGKLDASLTTMRKLLALLPGDAVVIPGHGGPTGIAAIKYPIGYLAELKQQVSAAIDAGLTEPETVQRLAGTMKRYSGYKIFPWVHSHVNVPKTYQEAKLKN
jgi:glyoxylase-like metal-dependent hydrolase (beta-lactamase superfamily II)